MLTVPSYANDRMQKALINAAKIAQIEAQLVDESTAILYQYARSNISNLLKMQAPEIVAFIDIGQSKTTVTVVKYSLSEADQ